MLAGEKSLIGSDSSPDGAGASGGGVTGGAGEPLLDSSGPEAVLDSSASLRELGEVGAPPGVAAGDAACELPPGRDFVPLLDDRCFRDGECLRL